MGDMSSAAEKLALKLSHGGLQKMTARVLSTLLFTEQEAITMGEIATQLGASAGSVSTAIKTLSGVGLIERVPSPGSRREHYRFPDNGWARLMSTQNELVQMMQDAAQSGIDAIGDEKTTAGKRLVLMRDFHAYMMRELPTLIDSWYEEHERQQS